MKATKQFYSVVLIIMLYKVVLTFESVEEISKCDLTIQMKVTEQSFLVVLFTISGSINFWVCKWNRKVCLVLIVVLFIIKQDMSKIVLFII